MRYIAQLNRAAKFQSLLLTYFSTHLKHEYLTPLRESIAHQQVITKRSKRGCGFATCDSPRISWKMAVMEELIMGGDGLVCAANIQTCSSETNRPIVRLYPLEVTSSGKVALSKSPQTENTVKNSKMSGTNTQ